MSTYTTTEVRNKIAREIRILRNRDRAFAKQFPLTARETQWADKLRLMSILSLARYHFPKESIHAVANTDRISA